MAAAFGEVWKESGVDEQNAWMMAPLGGVNLVFLHHGDGFHLHYDENRLEVHDIRNVWSREARPVLSPPAPAHVLGRAVTDTLPFLSPVEAASRFAQAAVGMLIVGLSAASLGDALTRAAATSARLLLVRGKDRGEPKIVASNGQGVSVALDVAVKKRREVSVAFNFLQRVDPVSKGSVALTRGSPANVSDWLRVMNQIFVPQTNVSFRQHRATWVTVDLPGPVVNRKTWPDVVKQGDPAADWNIFLVKDFEPDQSYHDTPAETKGRDTLCDDIMGWEQGETLAHEAGHFLAERNRYNIAHPGPTHWLMVPHNMGRNGVKIPKEHANKINPT